jgi:hypothetical protein
MTSTLVLDKIDGRWIGIDVTPGTCDNAKAELWETMSPRELPSGALKGEFASRTTTSCARNRSVTLTRAGGVEPADPATPPPRVKSPAEALHGEYHETDTYLNGQIAEAHFDIAAYCLRTGERCLSSWFDPDQSRTLVFSAGRWA